jgi:tRNA-dihydrouridine synthase
VKVRSEVDGVGLASVAERIAAAGADAIHIDAMDSEAVVADVAAAADLFVIANNEVRDRGSVREYIEYGADAVSVGRPSRRPDGPVMTAVADALAELTTEPTV